MLRRWGPRGDGGAGMAEYAGLVVLAALILGALVAIGVPSHLEAGVSSAICRVFQGGNCGKPEASGKNPGGQNPGGQNPGDGQTGGPNNNGGQDGGDQNGNGPSLADLQKNADDAQKAADNAGNKYGNIKQQIIDLLKDFIGITDVEDCITKGSISACLWAAFDVGSLFFAALKIGKFAKAVKDAVKLYKEFNKGRKIIDRAKDAAKRAKDLLKKRRKACGLPVAYPYPNAPPRHVVQASLAMVPAAEPGECGSLSRETLDQAYNQANTPEKLEHVIDPAKHGFSDLVKASGGRQQALKRIIDSLGDKADLPAAGRFEVQRVINGETVTIRGAVVNGVPRLGTAFIPAKFPP